MPIPELMIAPMRRELVQHGFRELRTVEEVDTVMRGRGTILVAVNSACGCSGSRMRPAVIQALRNAPAPDATVTVFAGQDLEATARVREYFNGEPPSSPAIALLRDGELLYMIPRSRIERRTPPEVAAELSDVLHRFCDSPGPV